MTRDEIISMAREAGFEVHERKQEARVGMDAMLGVDSTAKLERFASLVADAERRKHQADIERWKGEAARAESWRARALAVDGDGRTVQQIRAEAAAAEREACAQVCAAERMEFLGQSAANNGRESDFAFGSVNSAERIEAAIRARGQQ